MFDIMMLITELFQDEDLLIAELFQQELGSQEFMSLYRHADYNANEPKRNSTDLP